MIAVSAPAKINLTLHVVGRRADGYHLLDSLVAFASLHDVVEVAAAQDLRLRLDGPTAGDLAGLPAQDNLALRAARRLAEAAGLARPGAAIALRKTLPVAGGIGGGSADAAAVLLALAQLWRVEMSEARLAELALALGADVPVCLASRPAFMSGIGEILTAAPALPPLGILLANPRVALPTAEVFRTLAGRFGPATPVNYEAGNRTSLLAALRAGRNDLEAPARALAPVVGDVLDALAALPGARLARMSGSGATCFALFDDDAAAQAAAAHLRTAPGEWWVGSGRLIGGRDEIRLSRISSSPPPRAIP